MREKEIEKMLVNAVKIHGKRQLESLGFSVYCIDGTEQIGGVLDEIEQR